MEQIKLWLFSIYALLDWNTVFFTFGGLVLLSLISAISSTITVIISMVSASYLLGLFLKYLYDTYLN